MKDVNKLEVDSCGEAAELRAQPAGNTHVQELGCCEGTPKTARFGLACETLMRFYTW